MEPMEDNTVGAAKPKVSVLRTGRMMITPITVEEYETNYWPQLEGAMQHLLTTKPTDYVPISYEQMYTCVYKCVCKHFAERLYSDLIQLMATHLERVHTELQYIFQSRDVALFTEGFNAALSQYLHALKAIVPIFNYLNRFYVENKLKMDLGKILVKLFVDQVSDKLINVLIPVMADISLRPFTVSPVVMSSIIKNLYYIQPEYVQLRPQLFAKYIPNILPACSLEDLGHYIQEAQQMQRDLLTHPDFIGGDQSRKRHSDDDHIAMSTSSYLPTDYSS